MNVIVITGELDGKEHRSLVSYDRRIESIEEQPNIMNENITDFILTQPSNNYWHL